MSVEGWIWAGCRTAGSSSQSEKADVRTSDPLDANGMLYGWRPVGMVQSVGF
jgi:hypothetical protein